LMPYLHLPFQSGADRILAAMNRKHTVADYLRLIDRIRDARPEIALSTDIIVGFPGETDAEFEATVDLVKRVTFAQAYSFKYSTRPGTPAAAMNGHISDAVKSQRLAILQEVLSSQQTAFNRSQLRRNIPVLLEKKGRKPGQLAGRSPYLQAVHVDALEDQIGQIVSVNITHTGANSLSGVVFSETDSAMTPLDTAVVAENSAAANLGVFV
jgi:tRNA-2-methylthio-N6-dimethylallyladenosine synthase